MCSSKHPPSHENKTIAHRRIYTTTVPWHNLKSLDPHVHTQSITTGWFTLVYLCWRQTLVNRGLRKQASNQLPRTSCEVCICMYTYVLPYSLLLTRNPYIKAIYQRIFLHNPYGTQSQLYIKSHIKPKEGLRRVKFLVYEYRTLGRTTWQSNSTL